MHTKNRLAYGRSRTPARSWRRPGPSDLAAAQQVAARFVAARWPGLASVTPEVMRRAAHAPSADLLTRLGLDSADLAPRAAAPVAYTFVFVGHCGTVDGAPAPLVAAVTVDAQRRVVKASLSK
jgi:hypothetical protein